MNTAPMNSGWWLLARARRTTSAILIIIMLGLLEWILGSASVKLSHDNSLSVPWAVIIPIAAATVVGTASRSAVTQLELGTTRSLHTLRAAHLALILAVTIAATALGSAGLAGDISAPAAIRNLLGFTGLALLAAALLGANLAWTAPVALGLAALTAGAAGGKPYAWAWPIHYNNDSAAALTAAFLFILGALALVYRGAREPAAEHQ